MSGRTVTVVGTIDRETDPLRARTEVVYQLNRCMRSHTDSPVFWVSDNADSGTTDITFIMSINTENRLQFTDREYALRLVRTILQWPEFEIETQARPATPLFNSVFTLAPQIQ